MPLFPAGPIGGPLGEVPAEGLLILAWVALWRPIETISFDSCESREERRLLAKLSRVPIRFVATASTWADLFRICSMDDPGAW